MKLIKILPAAIFAFSLFVQNDGHSASRRRIAPGTTSSKTTKATGVNRSTGSGNRVQCNPKYETYKTKALELKRRGFTPEQVATELRKLYPCTDSKILKPVETWTAKAMREARYVETDVIRALKSLGVVKPEDIARHMRSAGHSHILIAKGLIASNYAANAVAQAMLKAGFSHPLIAKGLKTAGINNKIAGSALKSAGAHTNAIATSLKSAGYSYKAVAESLKVISCGVKCAASAMRSAQYSINSITEGFKSLNYTAESIAEGLAFAQYSHKEISRSLKRARYAADKIARGLRKAGYGVWKASEALKDSGYGWKVIARAIKKVKWNKPLDAKKIWDVLKKIGFGMSLDAVKKVIS